MATDADSASSTEDWRLEIELGAGDSHHALHGLIGRVREPGVVQDVKASVDHDVVITHDGSRLFAYAAGEAALRSAREAIEGVLERDGVQASVRVSRWDGEHDRWEQTDPPPSAEQRRQRDALDSDGEAVETRTLVAKSGKLVREDFEQTMLEWAGRVGVECEIVEHPHMLTTQVAFTVTGPKRKVDEFSRGLMAEGWSQIRTETGVMLNPL
jgi:hypothetical protein